MQELLVDRANVFLPLLHIKQVIKTHFVQAVDKEIVLNTCIRCFALWPIISWQQVFLLSFRFINSWLIHSLKIPWIFLKNKHGRASIQGDADKSVARPGGQLVTATKLWIYSTYSPRSSIHFLSHCSNFWKPLKKKFRRSVQPGLCGSNYLRVGQKMGIFQLFFQSREQVVVRRGQIWRIGWVMKTLEAHVGQFLLGFKCPVSWALSCKNKTPLVTLQRRFSFKMSFNCTSRDE